MKQSANGEKSTQASRPAWVDKAAATAGQEPRPWYCHGALRVEGGKGLTLVLARRLGQSS